MNVDLIRLIWEIGVGLVSAIAFVTAWRSRKSAEERAKEEEDRKAFGLLLDRMQKVETTLQYQPTTRDIDVMRQMMSSGMAALAGDVKKLEGTVEASTRMTERMNQYLMERGT